MIILNQSFSFFDLPIILFIGFIELLLSADNAGVLAIIVKDLPVEERKKALFSGLIGAFTFRIFGVIFASYFITLFWFQILGGLYLTYLMVAHLIDPSRKVKKEGKTPFYKAVLKIELMDILFAFDSILSAFALAALYYPKEILTQKLWVIYLGGILGLTLLRVGTAKILRWMDRHPSFQRLVFLIVGWIGLKLIFDGCLHFFPKESLETFVHIFFWAGSILLLVIGFISTKWDKRV